MYSCKKSMSFSLVSIVHVLTVGSLVFSAVESSSSGLALLTSCTCPGYQLIFECTVFGGGATVWRGTALDQCPRGQLFMRHSEFQSGRTWTCINGQIIGRTVRVSNLSYTSQLAVTVSNGLIGRDVQCSHDNGTTGMPYVIGVSTIQITTAPDLPSPSNISLSLVRRGELTFRWDPVVQNCPALHYNIIASNCGECSATVEHNFIRCTNVTELALMESSFCECTMRVQTVVCDSVLGTISEPLQILVKAPNAPNIAIIPEYSGETRLLKRLLSNLTEPEHFYIYANGIDGSATSYTILFSEATSGDQCDFVSISASTCKSGVCSYEFEVSSSSCPPLKDITVTAFATNVLGDGPLSNAIFISAVNNFIQVKFEFAINISTILCIFSDEAGDSVKHCGIIYGPNECHNTSSLVSFANGEPSASQTVEIPLSLRQESVAEISDHDHQESYCYKITGTNRTNTITVSGIFVTGCNPAPLGNDRPSTHLASLCGASHTPLSIDNGFVCYSETTTGSNAFYYCFDCGYNSINKSGGSFIRTCKSNGEWDGTIPRCDCSHMSATISSQSEIGLITGFMACLLLLLGLIITLIIIAVILLKIKVKLTLELKKERDKNILYDVIDVNSVGLTQIPDPPVARVNTAVNIAYTHVTQ